MNCPVCNQVLQQSVHTDLIYSCLNTDDDENKYHYAAHYRRDICQYTQRFKGLVVTQEDFQFGNYLIIKVWDWYAMSPENYFLAEEWENPGWRWSFELSHSEFIDLFPSFNPANINAIKNKLDLFHTFS